jgi:ATP-dependent helicase Lhr and Lhr-like helicase
LEAVDLLKRDIIKYIYDQGWPALRQIQEAAIKHTHEGEDNLVLAAPTASGKTEAAFLPAINGVDDWTSGVKIIYVSPLIALINDQFKRITELCEYLDVPVTSWHGESSKTGKQHLVKNPRGILLITPESIEAMLVRRPAEAKALLGKVEWVIVDELHSFLDTSRGVHLKALLGRMRGLAEKPARYIGMTATLNRDSYSLAKKFFGNARSTSVLLDKNRNELTTTLFYEKAESVGVPSAIIDDIFEHSCNESMLVFPNARGRVEEIAVGLKRRSKKAKNNVKYFAHHASVDKELRLEAEEFAKTTRQQLFTICCTSTLELGIDIGAVDSVAQVEGAPSVASLAQRLGRSGRQKRHSILHLYASKEWSLLQNLATLELYKAGTLEEVIPVKKPYNVLAQQVLSVLLEHSELSRADLLAVLAHLDCWGDISTEDTEKIVDHLLSIDFLENVDGSYITGLAAERVIESKDFYAHFEPKAEFKVVHDHEHIGEMPLSITTVVGANIFLAARIWKISEIDVHAKKIYVSPAKDGKPPVFGGNGGDVSHLVRRKMLECLQRIEETQNDYEPSVQEALHKLARESLTASGADFLIKNESGKKQILMTFAGSKINRTLLLLLKIRSEGESSEYELEDFESSVTAPSLRSGLVSLLESPTTDRHVMDWFIANEKALAELLIGVKYLDLLPKEFQADYLVSNYFDVSQTNDFLNEHQSQIRLP